MGLFTKIFGTYSERELKSIYPIVDKIEALSDEYKALTDAQLQAKTLISGEQLCALSSIVFISSAMTSAPSRSLQRGQVHSVL